MKRSIPEAFRGSISESENAKKFLEEIEQYLIKNEKAEASNLLAKLISMKYKGKSNIREYLMEMSNLASKLKALKLELGDITTKYTFSIITLTSVFDKNQC